MSDALLIAEHLELWRGDRRLFSDVRLALRPGSTLAVRGPNGSGKTSLLRVLCGLSLPEEGAVHWRGQRIDRDRDHYHAELSYLGHRNALNGELSAAENLRAALHLRRPAPAAEIERTLEQVGLGAAGRLSVRRLSAGQQRRAALARVLLESTRLWLLDEPTANLDTAGNMLVERLIDAHTRSGGIAIVATHRPLAGGQVDVLELG